MQTGEVQDEIDWHGLLLSALKVGIKHEEFWRLTPSEIIESIQVWNENKEEEMQRLAWAVAMIIDYTGRLKRPVKPADLLGKPVKKITPEEKQKEWNELVERMKGDEANG
jgi:hypothetical protein